MAKKSRPKSKQRASTMGMDSINVSRADNGFVISGWDNKNSKEFKKVAKSKAEAKRALDDIFK